MKKTKYSVAIFDMDGTILDTLQDLTDSINFALEENGFAKRSLEEVRTFVGNGVEKLVERAVPENTPFQNIQRVLDTFNGYYTNHCALKTKPYDGIVELLKNLKNLGFKVAVVSNKPDYGVKSLCSQYFDGIFDSAAGIKDGTNPKPSPDTVNRILEILGCEKKSAVYIGDSDVDIMTAKNAGIKCISVDWGFKTKEFLIANGATEIVDTCEELFKCLTK